MITMLCYHPEWGACSPKPEPAWVNGCCSRNYCCPVCGFGAGCHPHDDCQGWPELPEWAKRIAADPHFLALTQQAEQDVAEGRVVRLDDLKKRLGV